MADHFPLPTFCSRVSQRKVTPSLPILELSPPSVLAYLFLSHSLLIFRMDVCDSIYLLYKGCYQDWGTEGWTAHRPFLNLPFLFLDGGIASVVEGDSQFGA